MRLSGVRHPKNPLRTNASGLLAGSLMALVGCLMALAGCAPTPPRGPRPVPPPAPGPAPPRPPPSPAPVPPPLPPLGADFVNQPAGLQVLSDISFTSPGRQPGTAIAKGEWYRPTTHRVGRISLESLSALGLPRGPLGDLALCGKISAGDPAGRSSFRMDFEWPPGTPIQQKLYLSVWFLHQAGWQDLMANGHKYIWYLGANQGGASIAHFIGFWGPSQLKLGFDTQFNKGGGFPSAAYHQNASAVAGAWHRLEAYIEAGSAGNRNGLYQLWLDGRLIKQVANVPMSAAPPAVAGFRGMLWQPMINGSGAAPQSQRTCIQRWMMAGAP